MIEQIDPAWVHLLDQADLPGAPPFLDATFAPEGVDAIFVLLDPDQPGHAILLGKTGIFHGAVLGHASPDVVCRACIQRAVGLAGHDVGDESQVPAPLPGPSLGLGLRRDEWNIMGTWG
jgi:hypothetical protein